MAAPIAGMAISYIVRRGGIAVVRVVARHATKRAITKKMRRKPDPPQRQSRGGEHTASSGTPVTRKSMRGPSAQKRSRRGRQKSTYFRRDEDRYT